MPAAVDVLVLLNGLRARGASCGAAGEFTGALPLQWNPSLADGAARLAQRLALDGTLTHAPNGLALGERLSDVHYRYRRAAENIAAGAADLEAATAGWMASPSHCANLMGAALRDVGVACAASPGNGIAYWTMVLGTRDDDDGRLTASAMASR